MVASPRVLLYSNRDNELDQYARILSEAQLEMDLVVCANADDVKREIANAEIVFGVHLPAESYAGAKNLRWIQSMWAGVEGLINAPLSKDVIVTKPWGVFGRFLSNYVFGNLLAEQIKYRTALEAQAKGQWLPYRIETLQGKRMGIAGLGDVAAETAAVAKAFGMSVWALNSDGRSHPLAERTFAGAELNEFVEGLDVLVLTLPATVATRGMFNRTVLSRLPACAWIINVGRGALIDDEALVELLKAKKIRGAILDVFQQEPLPGDHPYWRLENCIVTPHIGGPSLPEDICRCFIENYKRYQSGMELLGVVDLKRGY